MTQEKDAFEVRRAQRRKKIRKRRARKIFLFFLIVSLIVFSLLSVTVLFPIKNITVSGSNIYTENQIISASKIGKKTNIFTVSREKTEEKIRQKLPFVDSIKFKRVLPDTLQITVKDAAEFASYFYSGKYYTVSKRGYVLSCYDEIPAGICEINAGDGIKCEIGKKIVINNNDTEAILQEILNALSNESLKVNSIDLSDRTEIKATVGDKYQVIFGNDAYIENKVRHLSAMLKNIGESKGGTANLSMWSPEKKEGTFIENK